MNSAQQAIVRIISDSKGITCHALARKLDTDIRFRKTDTHVPGSATLVSLIKELVREGKIRKIEYTISGDPKVYSILLPASSEVSLATVMGCNADFGPKPSWCSYSCEGQSLSCWNSGQDESYCKTCGFYTGSRKETE